MRTKFAQRPFARRSARLYKRASPDNRKSMEALPPSVAGFIAEGRVGRLGTADASGQPLVVPICYAFDGESLFSAIDAKPKTPGPRGLRRRG